MTNHLNDTQLVELLYDDSASPDSALQEHVNSCEACRKRLAELQSVCAELDSADHAIPASETRLAAVLAESFCTTQTGPDSAVESLTNSPDGHRRADATGASAHRIGVTEETGASALRLDVTDVTGAGDHRLENLRTDGRRGDEDLRWQSRRIALAASLMLALASAVFAAGTMIESRRSLRELQETFARQIESSVERAGEAGRDETRRWVGELLNESLGQRNDELAVALESLVRKIGDEQSRLRQDVELLAVNAESEIRLTRDELALTAAAVDQLQQLARPGL